MRLMRFSRAIVFGLLLSFALAGCMPANVQRTPAEIEAAQSAASLAQQGQFEQAAQAYLALAAQSSSRQDHYRLLAAEAWRQEGRIDLAANTLAQIDRQQLSGDEPVRLDLLRAELALSRHDDATALRLTTQPHLVVPTALQPRLLELRARAMAATGDNWGAARSRIQMDSQLTGFDRAQNRQQALALLRKLGIPSLQQRAAAMKPGDRMLSWVNEALSQLGVVVAQSQAALNQPVGTLVPGPAADVREGYKVPAKVALLLPGDGNFAAAGRSIREGFFAAYMHAGHNHAPRPAVRVYNSHGTTAGSIAGYQQAVADGAQFVVGPLTRDDVAAVFSQTALPVPVLALNHPDDRQLPAGDSSEFGLLPENEGAQAADHMIERGLQHAYVIIARDDFAQRAASAFKAEFIARGGQVDGIHVVADFTSALQGMNLGNYTSKPGSSVPASPDTGIFISMRPTDARLLLPQLRVGNVQLPVFATSHVYAGSDDAAANRDLDGVEFCDIPWLFNAQPGLPDHDTIAALLPAARGGAGRLFAFGMDAWNLVPYIDWMRAHPGSYLPGATGQLTANPFGRVRNVLIWAKFHNGLARPLGGSLQINDVPGAAPAPDAQPAPASSTATPGNAASAH
ncbi:MAG: penicillin-binding protein activator [Rhodanobacter sp.]|nr:MAG: penicillin-binding protein activator [Rhodanobacter sp.]